MDGRISRSRRLLLYSWKFKGCQKISGLESIWQLQNPGSMKKFRVIRKDSGLKSGSREVSLTEAVKYPVYNLVQGKSVLPQSFEALNIRFKIPVQEEFISCKKLKIAEEDLLPRCAVRTWVSRLTGLTYYWSHGGFCFLKRGLCSFTSCVVTRSCSKAASGLPLELAFQSIMLYHLGAWSCPNQCNTSW